MAGCSPANRGSNPLSIKFRGVARQIANLKRQSARLPGLFLPGRWEVDGCSLVRVFSC